MRDYVCGAITERNPSWEESDASAADVTNSGIGNDADSESEDETLSWIWSPDVLESGNFGRLPIPLRCHFGFRALSHSSYIHTATTARQHAASTH
eukprot:COSAG02_NODE_1560_length_11925_cov_4.963386_2_plen_95_part_00